MKGKLPVTELIVLESDESQWRLFTKGLIRELKTTGVVKTNLNQKVRIKLVLTYIAPPESLSGRNKCSIETNMGKDVSVGMSRSRKFLMDFLDKTIWLFMGYIEGEEKPSIFITHYPSINISVYTQKLKGDDAKKFFPELN